MLHGDGAAAPLELWNCSDWLIEGLVLMNEHNPDVAKGVDVGTVAMLQGGHDLTLRRLLLMRSNNQRHTHILRIIEAARVLVEECETYDFYQQRVRGREKLGGHARFGATTSTRATRSASPTRSASTTRRAVRVAIQVEESASSLLENNVAEVVGTGFSVVARSDRLFVHRSAAVRRQRRAPVRQPGPRPRLGGSAFGSRRAATPRQPCVVPERIVTDTLIVNGVALQTPIGVSVDAAPGTRVDNLTLVDVQTGVALKRSVSNAGLTSRPARPAPSCAATTAWRLGRRRRRVVVRSLRRQAPAIEAIDFVPQRRARAVPSVRARRRRVRGLFGAEQPAAERGRRRRRRRRQRHLPLPRRQRSPTRRSGIRTPAPFRAARSCLASTTIRAKAASACTSASEWAPRIARCPRRNRTTTKAHLKLRLSTQKSKAVGVGGAVAGPKSTP